MYFLIIITSKQIYQNAHQGINNMEVYLVGLPRRRKQDKKFDVMKRHLVKDVKGQQMYTIYEYVNLVYYQYSDEYLFSEHNSIKENDDDEDDDDTIKEIEPDLFPWKEDQWSRCLEVSSYPTKLGSYSISSIIDILDNYYNIAIDEQSKKTSVGGKIGKSSLKAPEIKTLPKPGKRKVQEVEESKPGKRKVQEEESKVQDVEEPKVKKSRPNVYSKKEQEEMLQEIQKLKDIDPYGKLTEQVLVLLKVFLFKTHIVTDSNIRNT